MPRPQLALAFNDAPPPAPVSAPPPTPQPVIRPEEVRMICCAVYGLHPNPFGERLVKAQTPPTHRFGQRIRARYWTVLTIARPHLYLTRDGEWIASEWPEITSAWYERTSWPGVVEGAHEAAEACRRATGGYPPGWQEALDEARAAAR